MYDPSSTTSAQAREIVQLMRAHEAEAVSRAASDAATRAELYVEKARADAEAKRSDELRQQLAALTEVNAGLVKTVQMLAGARN
jgi:hypothetical protein